LHEDIEGVTELGLEAYTAIHEHDFKGNFRELENTLRGACLRAVREDRNYICKSDL
jgi:transcriptional regulator with GAF, ATPase, and Fis domain